MPAQVRGVAGIHGDAEKNVLVAIAAEVGGVHESGSTGIELERHGVGWWLGKDRLDGVHDRRKPMEDDDGDG